MKRELTFLVFALVITSCSAQRESATNPAAHWWQYEHVEDAGFDPDKISGLKDVFLSQGGDVLLIVRDGKVVLGVGQTARCLRQTSVRKSYLNALYGIYSGNGVIDLESTLVELGIDDLHKLDQSEKEASIMDLLKSRSGVYHPAAYSPESMEKRLPGRGSAKHGEKWFYNNWDFNTLGTIFTNETGKDIFEEFEKQIALPLQFEDFEIGKTKLLYERDKSMHPAYLFRTSARDMARFGLLYLNKGRWNGEQILDPEWVTKSFAAHSRNGLDSSGIHWDDYGLLWWISNQITEEPVMYASGSGVQRITVFPASNMVMVHLVDNFQPKQVNEEKVDHLTRLLIAAKTGEPKADPDLTPFQPEKFEPDTISIAGELLERYEGDYSNPRMGKFTVEAKKNALLMQTGIGNFLLHPTSDTTFINEDIQIPVVFQKGTGDEAGMFSVGMNDKRRIEQFEFFYESN